MKRCTACLGTGKQMAMGMISVDCDICDGKGKSVELDLKSTSAYKEAKDKLKVAHDLSDADAEKALDDAIGDSTPAKKGRPKKNAN